MDNSSFIDRYFPEIFIFSSVSLLVISLFVMNSVMFPFFAAAASAYITYPLFLFTLKVVKKTRVSALLIVFFLVLIIAGTILVILPVLIKQVESFIDYLPTLLNRIDFYLSKFLGKKLFAGKFNPESIKTILSTIYQNISIDSSLSFATFAQKIFSGVFSIASIIINLVIIPILTYYFFVDWKGIKDLYLKLAPKKHRKETENLLEKVNESLAGYIRGQLLMALFVGLFFAVTLTAIGIRYSFLIAFAAGVMNMIPYVGFYTGLIPSLLLAIFDNGDLFHIVGVIVIFLSEAAIENVIYPMVMSRTTGIKPLLIFFAIFFGATYGGFLGIVIGVPVVAMILPVFDSFMKKRETE
ncbi:AI-2E family transporter [Desulfurobacterium atlanticum]|uniref:Predicted PurR-regulated permease PerM n=1 Tax=Desulfurobacterium atlanticum TaxID=240169 RepID=A0A238XRK6_9BACT|nr:AI-2E family transporter [Desulfurobacterium atlanticum]SNR61131.1 Predicted PurR-regulated permease PerM [Desulfurobacterium atlanticum]